MSNENGDTGDGAGAQSESDGKGETRDGPWATGTQDGDAAPGQSADGAKPKPRKAKASPWLPPEGAEAPPKSGARPGSFDAMLRKGAFSAQLPSLPGGQSTWGLIAAGVLGFWLVLTSVHKLEPAEEGVVTRFGSFSRIIGPGVSLTMPAPFEQVHKRSVRSITTFDFPDSAGENLILTGDQNIINLAYSVRWSIKQPELFEFQSDDPEGTIRDAAESAMRATIANFTLAQALGPGRNDIEMQMQRQLQAILDHYQIGVRVEGVAVRDSNAPAAVADAFNKVNEAQQESAQLITEAQSYAVRVRQQAEGEAAVFNSIYTQYRAAPEVTRRRLYYETMEQVLQHSDKTVVPGGSVTTYLPLPELRRRGATPPAAASAGAGTAATPAAPANAGAGR